MSGRAPRPPEPVWFRELRETEPEEGRIMIYHVSGDARWLAGDAVDIRP
jgi:hypothetical protein